MEFVDHGDSSNEVIPVKKVKSKKQDKIEGSTKREKKVIKCTKNYLKANGL